MSGCDGGAPTCVLFLASVSTHAHGYVRDKATVTIPESSLSFEGGAGGTQHIEFWFYSAGSDCPHKNREGAVVVSLPFLGEQVYSVADK